jgi:high affinity Mn2+ porin
MNASNAYARLGLNLPKIYNSPMSLFFKSFLAYASRVICIRTFPIFAMGMVCCVNIAYAASPVSDEPIVESGGAVKGETEQWSIHGQATYIAQQKNNFNSPYYGQNSLLNKTEGDGSKSYSLTATAFIGTRLWEGAEVYWNGEMFEGTPFTGQLVGLGGFQNGELQKGAFAPPVYYTARAFLRQTFGLGGGKEHIEGEANQLAGSVDKNRIVVSYGKFNALDFFDDNSYAHDPRTQFQNFAIFSMGAYGYAADTKGFTYGAVIEWYQDNYILKFARLAMPTVPNTAQLDYSLSKDYGNQVELTRSHELWGQPGAVRGLFYQQRAFMGNYQNAINQAQATNTSPPNVVDVRQAATNSWGYGLNLEQAINDDVGVFARWSWNPGTTETQTLDISKSISGGVSVKGSSWSRPHDTFGAGFAVNGISASQISYLQQGGMTAFIGDGALSYRTEQILETYYSAKVYKDLYITADYQRIANPAYNSARGPVNFFGIRAHIEM